MEELEKYLKTNWKKFLNHPPIDLELVKSSKYYNYFLIVNGDLEKFKKTKTQVKYIDNKPYQNTLTFASSLGREEIINYLLETEHLDFELSGTSLGLILNDYFHKKISLELVIRLIENHFIDNLENRNELMVNACYFGLLDLVKYLHSKNYNFNFQNDKYASPLLQACKSLNDNVELVKFLESIGCSIHDKINEINAYMLASTYNNFKIMEFLEKERFFDIHYRTTLGADVYLHTCYAGKLKGIKYLEKKGFDTSIINNKKWDKMEYAINGGNLEIVKYFVEKGYNIYAYEDNYLGITKNEEVKHFKSPYCIAARKNQLEILKYFDSIDLERKFQITRESYDTRGNEETNKYLESMNQLYSKNLWYNIKSSISNLFNFQSVEDKNEEKNEDNDFHLKLKDE